MDWSIQIDILYLFEKMSVFYYFYYFFISKRLNLVLGSSKLLLLLICLNLSLVCKKKKILKFACHAELPTTEIYLPHYSFLNKVLVEKINSQFNENLPTFILHSIWASHISVSVYICSSCDYSTKKTFIQKMMGFINTLKIILLETWCQRQFWNDRKHENWNLKTSVLLLFSIFCKI